MLNNNNVLRDFREDGSGSWNHKTLLSTFDTTFSSATHYLATGDIESLRKILGHTDLRTVLIYAHMADNTLLKNIQIMAFLVLII